MTEKSRLTPFLAYVVVFHLAWIAWPFVVYPRLEAIGSATLLYALLNIALRLLLWVAPVLLYLRYVLFGMDYRGTHSPATRDCRSIVRASRSAHS